jgi:hypothetical protein
MIFGGVKMVMVGVLVAAIAGAGIYVMKLQRDNAILKENQIKLEASVESQKKVIAQQAEDFGKILAANQKMNNLVNALKKDINDLDKRFNKGGRDFGKVAKEKPKVIERIINKGSDNALRCLEIAMGAEVVAVLLSGCSSVKKLDIFTTEVERTPLNLKTPTPPELEKLKWIIITSDNADEVMAKLEEQGIDPVLFGLTDKDFQLIAKNFAQIRAHMKKLDDIVSEYKNYYEAEETTPTK